MRRILRRCPYFDHPTQVLVGTEQISVKPHQVIVWVSVSLRETLDWNPSMPRFPAILDTGHSHNFSIHDAHLARWAGIQQQLLPVVAVMRESERRVPLRAAGLWLHPNHSGKRDRLVDYGAVRLETPGGIAVYPSQRGPPYPRLPLLGMRAITASRIVLTVDGDRRQVSASFRRR